jgi:hypothetical protein
LGRDSDIRGAGMGAALGRLFVTPSVQQQHAVEHDHQDRAVQLEKAA